MNLINNIASYTQAYGISTLQITAAWLLSTLLFAALIIYVAKHPQKRTMPLKIAFLIMFFGGMAVYCTCHYMSLQQELSAHTHNIYSDWVNDEGSIWFHVPYVVMRSVIDVGIMFYGRNNADVFYNLPIAKYPLAVFVFWLIHLIAFYTSATALLIRFGNDLLRWIRLVTSNISNIDIIYGINSDSIIFGRNISDINKNTLVYVDNAAKEDYETAIRDIGGITCADKDALRASPAFLKNIRVNPKKTKLRLYALSSEYDRNLQYARMMSASLQETGIPPENTELVLLGTDEWKGILFQSSESQYGYGTVNSFDESEMCARLLMHKYPLSDAINFDDNARATEDMNVLIVGFGRIGHEVLREIIASGQFEGSNFHAAVYDPNFEHRTGFFKSQYPNMFANYNIDFEPHGGRGSKIFKFIQDNAAKLKYIVICLDDRDTARDIAVHMVDRLQTLGYDINVYTCDTKSVRCYSQHAEKCETHWIYDSELLYSGEMDKYAMELNHRYCGGSSVYEDWKNCAYFDRMSSRASVDYLVPLLRKLITENGSLDSEQRENLAKSEHLRWCAFHYTFGYDVMDKEEFISRVNAYQKEKAENGRSSIKVTKDKHAKKHVCLVDWDDLDEISRIENEITHGTRNYKDSDRTNVDMVMSIIQNEEKKS